jgi:hypothetical protein
VAGGRVFCDLGGWNDVAGWEWKSLVRKPCIPVPTGFEPGKCEALPSYFASPTPTNIFRPQPQSLILDETSYSTLT